jgi:tight adherence protein B
MDLTVIAVACGAGTGIGMVLFVKGWKGNRTEVAVRSRGYAPTFSSRSALIGFGAAASGLIVGLLTGWPAAALFSALGILLLPSFVRATRRSRSTERTEAAAAWTELLRDTLSAASGLSQAIVTTAHLAPDPLKVPVKTLSARITNGMSLVEGLRLFADEIDDPSVDLVVCALTLAASARTQKVSDLLGALAQSMREEVVMRLRVESGRASARSGVRTIAIFSVVFMAALVLVARPYLSPFSSSQGQVVLTVAFLLDAVGIGIMLRLVRDQRPQRLLGDRAAFESM